MCCPFIPEPARTKGSSWFPDNPRQSKLIARTLGIFKEAAARHDSKDLGWDAIILQTILRLVAPETSAVVEAHFALGAEGWVVMDPEGKQQEQIAAAVDASGWSADASAKTWLTKLVRAVTGARRFVDPNKIAYEMGLAMREPCVTTKEFQAVLAEWAKARGDASLVRCLEYGATRADTSKEEAALDLVLMGIHIYGGHLDAAASTTFRPRLEAKLAEAGLLLELMEYLWRQSALPEVKQATASLPTCRKLSATLWQWVHFRRNPADQPLRERELSLMKTAASQCIEPLALYFDLEPNARNGPPIYGSKEERLAKERYATELLPILSPAAVEAALRWFTTRNGVRDAAIGESGHAPWVLSSQKSPLYCTPGATVLLQEILNIDVELADIEAQVQLAGNALDYLGLLVGNLCSGWRMSNLGAFSQAHPEIIRTAWAALSCVEPQFRMNHSMRQLRQRLLDEGVDPTLVPELPWTTEE